MKDSVIVSILALLLVGCAQREDPRDAKIRELERRVTAIASGLEMLSDTISTNLIDLKISAETQNRLVAAAMVAISEQKERDAEIVEQMSAVMVSLTNRRPTQVYMTQAQLQAARSQPPLKDGIPGVVYDQIVADAMRTWGTDFEMQRYVIKNQVQAYKDLHR